MTSIDLQRTQTAGIRRVGDISSFSGPWPRRPISDSISFVTRQPPAHKPTAGCVLEGTNGKNMVRCPVTMPGGEQESPLGSWLVNSFTRSDLRMGQIRNNGSNFKF